MGYSFRPLLEQAPPSEASSIPEPLDFLQDDGELQKSTNITAPIPHICPEKLATRSVLKKYIKKGHSSVPQSLPDTHYLTGTTSWRQFLARQRTFRKRLGANVAHQETTHGRGYQQIVLDLAAVTSSENLAALQINCNRSPTLIQSIVSKSETRIHPSDKAVKFGETTIPGKPLPNSDPSQETHNPNIFGSSTDHHDFSEITVVEKRGRKMIDEVSTNCKTKKRVEQMLKTQSADTTVVSENENSATVVEDKRKHGSTSWIRKSTKPKIRVARASRRRSVDLKMQPQTKILDQLQNSPAIIPESPSQLMAPFKLPVISTMERIHPLDLWNSTICSPSAESPSTRKSPKPSPAPTIPLPPLPAADPDRLPTSRLDIPNCAISIDHRQVLARVPRSSKSISSPPRRRKQSIGRIIDSGKGDLHLKIRTCPDLETDWIQRYPHGGSNKENACRSDESTLGVRENPRKTSNHAVRRAQMTKELKKRQTEDMRTQREHPIPDQDGTSMEYNPEAGNCDIPQSSYFQPAAETLQTGSNDTSKICPIIIVSEQEPAIESSQLENDLSPLRTELKSCETSFVAANISTNLEPNRDLITEDQDQDSLSQHRSSQHSSIKTKRQSTAPTSSCSEPPPAKSQRDMISRLITNLEARHEARYSALEQRTVYLEATLFRLLAVSTGDRSSEGLGRNH